MDLSADILTTITMEATIITIMDTMEVITDITALTIIWVDIMVVAAPTSTIVEACKVIIVAV